jgi:hypothetical protein
MATKYGVEATKRLNQSIQQLSTQGCDGGNVKFAYDTYELTADLGSGDIIKMCRIPAGAKILDVRCFFDDLDASGGTIHIGWAASADSVEAADADGFGASVDVTSAGVYSMFTSQSTVPGFDKTFSSEVQVQIATNGDTDATSGTLTLQVLYVVD